MRIIGNKSKHYTSAVLHHNVSTTCVDCRKHTTFKPWDNNERKKRCAKCYLKFCEQEAEIIHQHNQAKWLNQN